MNRGQNTRCDARFWFSRLPYLHRATHQSPFLYSFQCDNGHIACSSCCPKLKNKCPSCALPVGHSRCRAMESVLESFFIPCQNAKYGCTKTLAFWKESSTHEKDCAFAEYCSCPVKDCNYTDSYTNLYHHYLYSIHLNKNSDLKVPPNRFSCGISFGIKMNINDNKMLIQRTSVKRLLFPVQCFKEPFGVYDTVSCIAPSTPQVGEFSYCLFYTVERHTMIYKSPEPVKKIREVSLVKSNSTIFGFESGND
ncbi:hypothetical protein Bca101_065596 [Brassica carinata]